MSAGELLAPLDATDHALPSKWRIEPWSPTAHTSEGLLPQIPRSASCIVLAIDHALPSQRKTVPYKSIAQTLDEPLPQTPLSAP